MMRYSVQPTDIEPSIFAKHYEFLSFAKNIGKNIGKKIGKKQSAKYSQRRLNHTKQCSTDAFKTASKRAIQKQQKQMVT